ncbi:MAG: hypothetical protein GQ544_06220 [Candidatus Aminicenantes bacterium]|nr:hypothetical protein [Candidatus Aminicenantes bacterium]
MKKVLLWTLAVVITLFVLVYQRVTGPTYAMRGKVVLAGTEIAFELLRTHNSTHDCEIKIESPSPAIEGYIEYKRYPTQDALSKIPMTRQGDALVGLLPKQLSSGKLQYKVFLTSNGKEVSLSGKDPIIIRFKDPVPTWLLIAHIIVIFIALLLSMRTGLEALNSKANPRKLAIKTTVFLFLGGMILGPLMQLYAFGALWTGFPFGIDLTDNKTLFALIGWIIALIAGRGGKPARAWVLGAAVLTLVVFLIPHSVLGSELDYSEVESAPQIAALYNR